MTENMSIEHIHTHDRESPVRRQDFLIVGCLEKVGAQLLNVSALQAFPRPRTPQGAGSSSVSSLRISNLEIWARSDHYGARR